MSAVLFFLWSVWAKHSNNSMSIPGAISAMALYQYDSVYRSPMKPMASYRPYLGLEVMLSSLSVTAIQQNSDGPFAEYCAGV